MIPKIYIILFLFPIFSCCQNKENEINYIKKDTLNSNLNIVQDTLMSNVSILQDTLKSDVSMLKDVVKSNSFNEFNVIQFNDSIFSFKNFVSKSKVSIFIIGSKTCKPCIELQNTLKKKYLNRENNKVLVFKVVVPTRDDENYNSKGYIVFRDIDALAEIQPTTIIYAPTQNEYSRYVGIDNLDKLLKDIDELIKFCK